MTDKLIMIKAKKVLAKYSTYSEYSKNASDSEKKVVLKSTLIKANKLQRKTVKA